MQLVAHWGQNNDKVALEFYFPFLVKMSNLLSCGKKISCGNLVESGLKMRHCKLVSIIASAKIDLLCKGRLQYACKQILTVHTPVTLKSFQDFTFSLDF